MKRKTKEFGLIMSAVYEEYQSEIISGITEYAKDHSVNINCYTIFNDMNIESNFNQGESSVFNLINYDKLDGFIYLVNTIPDTTVKEELIEKIKKSGKPTVVFDYEDSTFYNLSIDNYTPMTQLVRHIIKDHNAKTLCFISGPKNNPEANTRLKAFTDVCEEENIMEYTIYSGKFRPYDGKAAVRHILKKKKLPDAIIAANDAMALSAIEELNRYGYSVPKDTIVTGFDYTITARNHYPSLTTIKRPLNELGKLACDILYNDKQNTNEMMSEVVLGESCGCVDANEKDIISYKQFTYNLINNSKHDSLALTTLTSRLSDANTIDDCINCIKDFTLDLNIEKICLCLYDAFNESIAHSALICYRGKVLDNTSTSITEPDPIPYGKGGNINYYFPIHFGTNQFGYMIIGNSRFPIRSYNCHTLAMVIGNAIENINKINRLNHAINKINSLYITDQLCNINNRYGLIRDVSEMIDNYKNKNKEYLVSFIDMDGLKYINDTFGHDEGDFSLKSIASVLKDVCTKNTLTCARFGGDEFVIFGYNETIEHIESTIRAKINAINAKIDKPYKIDYSIGSIILVADDDFDLFKIITDADKIMYEQKMKKKSKYTRQ